MRHERTLSSRVAISRIAKVVVTLIFAALCFLAVLTFWIGYINRKVPGAWMPLILPAVAMPPLFRAWLGISRTLSKQARKKDLLEL